MKIPMSMLALTLAAAVQADELPVSQSRRLDFPGLEDGRFVLAVDLHTHSVFSDGEVWPSVRVQEAQRDGLYGYAVTEHLEYQPKLRDIPHPDRNRSWEVATQEVQQPEYGPVVAGDPLIVINGAEITREMPPGHCNAVFLSDANALRTDDPYAAFREARRQEAFVFWNHPYWQKQTPDGVARMTPMHERLIKEGLLQGIEVANGADVSPEAFAIAEQHNLTIIGTSDIHGLIDWDYDLAGGAHRTATLVLAKDKTTAAVKAALMAGDTVAVYNETYIGLARNVEPLLRSVLRAQVGAPEKRTTLVPVTLVNSGSLDILLEEIGPEGFFDEAPVIKVPAHGSFTVTVRDVPDPAKLQLRFRMLSSMIGPDRMLEFTVGPGMAAAGSAR